MKKVLVIGPIGNLEPRIFLGSMHSFENLKDVDVLGLTSFSSTITSIPPDILVKISAILCCSNPDKTVQAISIAQHYRIPIAVTSRGIQMNGEKASDLLSETNLEILQSMSKETPVFYCTSDKCAFNALEFIAEDGRKPDFYTTSDLS